MSERVVRGVLFPDGDRFCPKCENGNPSYCFVPHCEHDDIVSDGETETVVLKVDPDTGAVGPIEAEMVGFLRDDYLHNMVYTKVYRKIAAALKEVLE